MLDSKQEEGFTLLEVLFALVMFAIVLIGAAPAFVYQAQINTQSELKSIAAVVAQQRLDELRFLPIGSIPASGTEGPTDIMIDGRTFSVVTSYCENAAYCDSANNRHITVNVSYNGEEKYEVQTVYTRLQ